MTETERKIVSRLQIVTGLVGGAFAVVHDNWIRSECFGWADKETRQPVTEQSFFDIASDSKAFTAMLGAVAADEGLFDWNVPIRHYFPEFGMTDEYAAAHMTGRDLGCHRSGLARHEFMRARVYTSIEDMALRTRYMAMSHGFRESYEYNNHMFIVLGHVLECIYQRPWRELILEKIAAPLRMQMRFRGRDCDFAGLDCALPYRSDSRGGAFRIPWPDNHVAGPCGGIRTNLLGMTEWLSCLLHSGAPLCSQSAFQELTTSNVPTSSTGTTELCCGYALGWRTSAYRGRRLVSHGGAIGGFNSHVAFFPDEGMGLVVLLNTSATGGAAILRDTLLDELCGAEMRDIGPELADWQRSAAGSAAPLLQARQGRVPDDADLCMFGGRFYHPAYDDFTVTHRDNDVWLDYGSFRAPLRLLEDGTALACEDDPSPDWMKLSPAAGGLLVETSDLAMQLPFSRIE